MAAAQRSEEAKPKKRRSSRRHCCVPGCTNDNRLYILERKLSFHRFPKDEAVRKQWIWKIRRDEGLKVTAGTAVCSDHFLPSDFKRSLTGIKRDLKKGAIPTVFTFPDGRPENKRKTRWQRTRTVSCSRSRLASDCSSDGTEIYSRSRSRSGTRSRSRSREESCDDEPSVGIDVAEELPVFFQTQDPPEDNRAPPTSSSEVTVDTKPPQPMKDSQMHVQPMRDSKTHVQPVRDSEIRVHIKCEPVTDAEEEVTLGMKVDEGAPHTEALTDVQVMSKSYLWSSSHSGRKLDTSCGSSSKPCCGSKKDDSLCSSKSNFPGADSVSWPKSAPVSDSEFCIHFKSEPVSDSETNEDAPSEPVTAKYADGVLEEENAEEETLQVMLPRKNAEEETLQVTLPRKRRFAEVSNNSVHANSAKEVASKSTMKKTECDIRLLRNFIAEKFPEHEKTALYDMADAALCKVLCHFFAGLKRSDGSDYEPSSLRGFVASVDRIMITNNRNKISMAKEFETVQEVLKRRIKMMKVSGTVSVPRRAWLLSQDEIETLWRSGQLGTDNPRSMINTLWWYNTTLFGIRTVTPHRQLRWGDVTLSTDPGGRRFLTYEKLSSRAGADAGAKRDTHGKARAYENKGNPQRCPVELYIKYAAKRPEKARGPNSPFYLACNIRPNVSLPAEMWFKNLPTGVNTIRRIMRNMAVASHLGKIKKLSKHAKDSSLEADSVTSLHQQT